MPANERPDLRTANERLATVAEAEAAFAEKRRLKLIQEVVNRLIDKVSHDGPIRRGRRRYILTTDQSDAGSVGIFSRRTNQTREAWVYSAVQTNRLKQINRMK
eukprot:1031970-Pyramimonas_sp.AAC.1